MARVISVNRATKSIIEGCGGPAFNRGDATGWHLEMDQSVLWQFIFENSGPRPVRFIQCQPGGFPNLGGSFCIVATHEKTMDSKVDNGDQFFYAEYQDENGNWIQANGGEGYSDNTLTNNNNACVMKWHEPWLMGFVVVAY